MTGSEMQREKEKVAAKMREKQAAGKSRHVQCLDKGRRLTEVTADAKKATETAAKK